ncbi:hypothetical protein EC968_005584 [Mortierella alpina]|nr:hypothetical protein EC968_005584 [Mortierella alpina]
MLSNRASRPEDSFGSPSSSSSHQQRIPTNMHHSAGSNSGAAFRPPSQSFTQHQQDQNHSLSSHQEQQPHSTRFEHTHAHHSQSRSYNSFHDFEEDEDEDRRSDDGSEGEPGFNDIEFWLQRCSICFDARLDFCLEFCRDQFCRECFQRYVKEVVSNSWGLNITKIKCPVCQDTIPLAEWTKYVDRATFAQYNQYNQPYRSFSRFCGGCEQEVVVSDVKRKIIGLPVQDLLPFFEGFLEDLRALMQVGGLALEKLPGAAASSPAKATLNRPIKGSKNEPEFSERDIIARKIVQRFIDDFQALCGVTNGPHPRFPSMAQSYLSSLTLRMGASLSSAAPAASVPSQQTTSLPPHQAASSSGSHVQGSHPNPNPSLQSNMEPTARLPISIFPRRLTAFSSNGVLELYKTLMVSLLDLFDLSHESQKTPMGDSIRAKADDVDMALAPRNETWNDSSTPPAGTSSDQSKLSVDDIPSGQRIAHHSRPRVMTRAMTKQQAAVKKALVRLSKDISSVETRPEQWKELQFLHVRWLRWDWCHTCDQELCLQCGVSTHHENMDCFAYMRSLIVGDIEPSISRRKRPHKTIDQESPSTGGNDAKGKDRKDVDASTIQWKLSNTNPCPNCCILIHRDDGCNKVDCMLCGHRFCWVCREAWGVGCGFFKCGRQPVDVAASEGVEDESENAVPPSSTEDPVREGHVQVLAVVDSTLVQAESSQTGRRRRRSEDISLEVSEKPEIGVPNVFVIQAKRSRA